MTPDISELTPQQEAILAEGVCPKSEDFVVILKGSALWWCENCDRGFTITDCSNTPHAVLQ